MDRSSPLVRVCSSPRRGQRSSDRAAAPGRRRRGPAADDVVEVVAPPAGSRRWGRRQEALEGDRRDGGEPWGFGSCSGRRPRRPSQGRARAAHPCGAASAARRSVSRRAAWPCAARPARRLPQSAGTHARSLRTPTPRRWRSAPCTSRCRGEVEDLEASRAASCTSSNSSSEPGDSFDSNSECATPMSDSSRVPAMAMCAASSSPSRSSTVTCSRSAPRPGRE